MALQGAEMILLGYNTPRFFPQLPKLSHLADFHSHLVMQASAYQSGAWVVGTAKAGWEEGCDLIGESCIVEIGRATSELQSLMRNSYTVICLTKTKTSQTRHDLTYAQSQT